MKKIRSYVVLISVCIVAVAASSSFAQKPRPAAKPLKPMVFAVLNDGKSVEPIAYINKGKLETTVNGSDEKSVINAFSNSYYKTGAGYRLVFGGADAGNVTVKSSNAKTECAANTANVTATSSKTTLKGFVMALATNAEVKNKTLFRRKPTTEEKSEIDGLVRSEYSVQKLTPKTLHYQNLTAVDINHDGKAEFVGSYWIEVDKLTRALLFFIAEKGSNGKYGFTYSDFRSIDQAGVMSSNIKDVDDGVYHELLLDTFDYDGDGVGEIFTYEQSFEGAGFTAYKKSGGKWVKAYEFSNYHCGY